MLRRLRGQNRRQDIRQSGGNFTQLSRMSPGVQRTPANLQMHQRMAERMAEKDVTSAGAFARRQALQNHLAMNADSRAQQDFGLRSKQLDHRIGQDEARTGLAREGFEFEKKSREFDQGFRRDQFGEQKLNNEFNRNLSKDRFGEIKKSNEHQRGLSDRTMNMREGDYNYTMKRREVTDGRQDREYEEDTPLRQMTRELGRQDLGYRMNNRGLSFREGLSLSNEIGGDRVAEAIKTGDLSKMDSKFIASRIDAIRKDMEGSAVLDEKQLESAYSFAKKFGAAMPTDEKGLLEFRKNLQISFLKNGGDIEKAATEIASQYPNTDKFAKLEPGSKAWKDQSERSAVSKGDPAAFTRGMKEGDPDDRWALVRRANELNEKGEMSDFDHRVVMFEALPQNEKRAAYQKAISEAFSFGGPIGSLSDRLGIEAEVNTPQELVAEVKKRFPGKSNDEIMSLITANSNFGIMRLADVHGQLKDEYNQSKNNQVGMKFTSTSKGALDAARAGRLRRGNQ